MLTGEEASLFRSALGLILYVSHDRPDISFATKTLATWMSYPCMKAMAALKHLALYLSGTEHVGVMLRKCEAYEDVFDRWIEADEWSDVTREQRKDRAVFNFNIFSDSSWGDDRSTRRSTSSCVMFVNGAYISSFSRTQATVALSSCEAELYAANAAIAKGLFLVRVCKFLFGDQKDENSGEVKVKLHVDSSEAMGTIQRAGFGRMKHLQIRHLFLQDLLQMKVFSLHKVSTKMNPADLGTKKLGLERRKDLGRLIGIFTGEDETSRRTEVLQTRRVQMILMTAFQAAAAALLQGCSSPSSFLSGQPSTSPTATSMADLRSSMVLGGVLMLMMGMLVMMVPGEASRSRSRSDPQPEYANVQQWTSEMRNLVATTFVLSAKAYWIDGQHDQF